MTVFTMKDGSVTAGRISHLGQMTLTTTHCSTLDGSAAVGGIGLTGEGGGGFGGVGSAAAAAFISLRGQLRTGPVEYCS